VILVRNAFSRDLLLFLTKSTKTTKKTRVGARLESEGSPKSHEAAKCERAYSKSVFFVNFVLFGIPG